MVGDLSVCVKYNSVGKRHSSQLAWYEWHSALTKLAVEVIIKHQDREEMLNEVVITMQLAVTSTCMQ